MELMTVVTGSGNAFAMRVTAFLPMLVGASALVFGLAFGLGGKKVAGEYLKNGSRNKIVSSHVKEKV